MFLTAEARKQRLAIKIRSKVRSSDLAAINLSVRNFTVLSYEYDGSSILALVLFFY